jgi:hypothetical protein
VTNQFTLPTALSNLTMWLDASDMSGFSYSQFGNAGQLAQWNDKSVNANHLSQSNITLMPVVQTGV